MIPHFSLNKLQVLCYLLYKSVYDLNSADLSLNPLQFIVLNVFCVNTELFELQDYLTVFLFL